MKLGKRFCKRLHRRYQLSRAKQCNICWMPLFIAISLSVASLIIFYQLYFKQSHIIPAFVLTLENDHSRLDKITEIFKTYANIRLKPFYGVYGEHIPKKDRVQKLSPGEQGLRESFKLLLHNIIKQNLEHAFIFEDDAIPHRNFTQLFMNLPSRCREADILLLGANIRYSKKSKVWEQVCFDADKKTYGTYGIYLKRSGVQPILDCLEKLPDVPVDHIHPCLKASQTIARVAYPPFLVIMDVSHKSLVYAHRSKQQYNMTVRSKIHHWKLDQYPIIKYE